MKSYRILAVSALCCGLLLWTAAEAPAQAVVKVGNILPLSGPSASVGLQNKQAQDMAVQEINDAGGINGRPSEGRTLLPLADPGEGVQA